MPGWVREGINPSPTLELVIPANAGIQANQGFKCPGSRIESGMTAKNKCPKQGTQPRVAALHFEIRDSEFDIQNSFLFS